MGAQPVVSMRFRRDDLDEIRAAAASEQSTVAEYIRGVALREVLARRPGARRLRTSSGAPLVVWSNHVPCPFGTAGDAA